MKEAAKKHFIMIFVASLAVAPLISPQVVSGATGITSCEIGKNCVVGEFLFDDSYAPITTTSCTVTSKNPDGSAFKSNEEMYPPASDGWYSSEFPTPTVEGTYRSQICCIAGGKTFATTSVGVANNEIVVGKNFVTDTVLTFSSSGALPGGLVVGTRYYAINVNSTTIKVAATAAGSAIDLTSQGTGTHTINSDTMCLDKSFNVVTASSLTQADVASAVWDASRSAHTTSGTFGEALQNVVPASSDIAAATWSYSGRSLSTFGNLVSDIWGNSSRTLSGFGNLVADIWGSTTSVKSDVNTLATTVNETMDLVEQLVNKPVVETTTEEAPDLEAKIQETDAVVSQLFVDVSYTKSKADLVKLRWDEISDDEILETTQELTRELGGENDTVANASIFGAVAYLAENWDWPSVGTAKTQTGAIRDLLVSLEKEIESGGRSKTAYGQLKALDGIFAQLDEVVGAAKDKTTDRTIFGKLAETKYLAATLADKERDMTGLNEGWDGLSILDRQNRLMAVAKSVGQINRIPSVNKTLLSGLPVTEKELRNRSYFVSGIISANKKVLAAKTGTTLSNTWLELGSIVFKTLVSNPSARISQKIDVKYYLPPEVDKEDIIDVDEGLRVDYDNEKSQLLVTGTFTLAPSETKTVAVRVTDIWTISPEEIASLRQQAEALAKPLEKTSYFAQGVTLKSDIDVSLDKISLLSKSNSTPENKIKAYREADIEMKAVREKIDKLKELAAQAGSVGTIFGFVGGAQTLAVWGLILILIVGFVFLALYMKVLIKKEETEIASAKKKTLPPNVGLIAILLVTLGIGLIAGLAIGRSGSPANSQILGQTATVELKK